MRVVQVCCACYILHVLIAIIEAHQATCLILSPDIHDGYTRAMAVFKILLWLCTIVQQSYSRSRVLWLPSKTFT